MAKISPIGIASRFHGSNGKRATKDSLLKQTLIANDENLAEQFCLHGEIAHFLRNQPITAQGNTDNDLYFLLCGAVQIVVNGYCVATRAAGTHFGEMAAMDHTALRSASVVAIEEVVVMRVPQAKFLQIAGRYSKVWQRMAGELAVRIRDRAKFLRNKNEIPILFIGSSTEGKDIATELKHACESKVGVEVRLWSDGVFQASKTTIEDLMTTADKCDFSVLVLTPDDKTKSKGQVKAAPRDNVIYELGLFTGALGRDRSLIVMPSEIDLKLPTDLLGVTTLRYKGAKTKKALKAQVVVMADQIVARIKSHGPK